MLTIAAGRLGRIVALGLAGLCLSAASPGPRAASAAHAAWPQIAYDIRAQPLTSAVETYALATGIQVLYDLPTGAEPSSPGVKGTMSPQDALGRLLVGTGLTAHFMDPRNVVLEPAAGAATREGASEGAPPDLPSLALGALHVTAPAVVEAPAPRGLAARRYGEVIKSSVTDALAADAKTSRARYRAGLSIWIAASGAVRKATVVSSSGRRELDATICAVLERVVVGETPPPDLPQPVNIVISSRTPR